MNLRMLVIAVAALAMTGCTTTTAVKTVMADKDAFLRKNFDVSTARPSMVATIRAADSGEVGFREMTISTSAHIEATNPSLAVLVPTAVIHYVHNGGPFIMRREERFSNGILNTESFGLTYRGVILLKSQDAQAGALNTSLVGEIKDFTSFTPVSGQNPPKAFALKFTTGTAVQGFNFQSGEMDCNAGETVQAATLNPKFTGMAQKYSCKSINNAGVQTETADQVYFEDYGFAITLRRQTATFTTTFEITDVTIS